MSYLWKKNNNIQIAYLAWAFLYTRKVWGEGGLPTTSLKPYTQARRSHELLKRSRKNRCYYYFLMMSALFEAKKQQKVTKFLSSFKNTSKLIQMYIYIYILHIFCTHFAHILDCARHARHNPYVGHARHQPYNDYARTGNQ